MPGAISTPKADHGPPAHVRGVYHITQPRSASNLFQNMMAKQPGFQNSGYKLFHAGFATLSGIEHGPLSAWPEEKRQQLYETFKAAFETLQDELEDAEKNVSFFSSCLFLSFFLSFFWFRGKRKKGKKLRIDVMLELSGEGGGGGVGDNKQRHSRFQGLGSFVVIAPPDCVIRGGGLYQGYLGNINLHITHTHTTA